LDSPSSIVSDLETFFFLEESFLAFFLFFDFSGFAFSFLVWNGFFFRDVPDGLPFIPF